MGFNDTSTSKVISWSVSVTARGNRQPSASYWQLSHIRVEGEAHGYKHNIYTTKVTKAPNERDNPPPAWVDWLNGVLRHFQHIRSYRGVSVLLVEETGAPGENRLTFGKSQTTFLHTCCGGRGYIFTHLWILLSPKFEQNGILLCNFHLVMRSIRGFILLWRTDIKWEHSWDISQVDQSTYQRYQKSITA